MGDHPWLGGTTYGTVDSPARPSMAAIDSPAGPPMAAKIAVDGSAEPIVGGTIGDVTGHTYIHTQKNRHTSNNMLHDFKQPGVASRLHLI